MKKIALLLIVMTLGASFAKAAERADSLRLQSECKFSLRNGLAGAVASVAINGALTEVLKNNIMETRPDGSGDHSFPSRHASYAFTIASICSHELYRFSPLWVSVSHTLANAVAMQRVYSERHYPGDVLAGATLGIASTELGYCISNWIFSGERCHERFHPGGNSRNISTSTKALITLGSHHRDGLAVGCGIESSVSLGYPVSECWGLGASIGMRSQPVYLDGNYVGGLNGASISADGYVCRQFGYWQADASVALGVIYNFDRPCDASVSIAPLLDLSASVYRCVARGFSIGPKIGVDITKRPSALCALTVSIVAKTEF
ncbi:MAG: phosphatase PAP2 family protein [Muribaculaceae bacterium]|nr:phosphatase PAP2 family protein [Muribaculaceae bacterium]